MAGIVVSGVSIADPGRVVAPAVNTWSRLEGLPLAADLEPALQAAVADPLWLLCRQWQFLELAGEDAGSPIDVRIEGELARLSRFRPGAVGDARDYADDGLALEVAVEAEPVRDHHARLAAEAGVHLQWLMNVGRLVNLFAAAYPVDPVDPEPGETGEADAFGMEWRAVAGVRGIDARKLLAALEPLRTSDGGLSGLPAQPDVPPDLQDRTLEALRRWLVWYEQAMVDPVTASAWDPSRLEYAFAVSAQTGAGPVVLTADEYADGTLDWYSLSPGTGSLGTGPASTSFTVPPVLPAPVQYQGKPADRFWEFEDAGVHFGAVDAGPTDLGRLLLLEFSLVYGNDWHVVPVRLPVGSLFRVTSCTVRDTFGVVTTLTRSRNATGPRWSVFDQPSDFFLLPPTLAAPLAGPAIERVQLARDEGANLAWGIEQLVQGTSGDPYERAEEASIAAGQSLDPLRAGVGLAYRLTSPVAEHWIPLVPVAAHPGLTGPNPVIQLERRALLRTDPDRGQRPVHPRGLVLRSDPRSAPEVEPPLRIEEEEIPREGAIVERAFSYARWFDGRTLLWLGRRKTAGRGESSSDLRYDVLRRPGG
jgi:hypothetical protein